jgi:hypothetical protein
MRGRGLSGKDMAAVLGVSPQRLSQLAPAAGATRKTAITADRSAANTAGKAKGSKAKSKRMPVICRSWSITGRCRRRL